MTAPPLGLQLAQCYVVIISRPASLSTQKLGTFSVSAVTQETSEFMCTRSHPRDWVNFNLVISSEVLSFISRNIKSVYPAVKPNHADSWAIGTRRGSNEVMFGEKQMALHQIMVCVKHSRWKSKETTPRFTKAPSAMNYLLNTWLLILVRPPGRCVRMNKMF